jgi:hypothetical protein
VGLFEDAFAWLDARKRATKRNLADAYQNPEAWGDMANDRLKMTLDDPMTYANMGMMGTMKGFVPGQASMAMKMRSMGLLDDEATAALMRLGNEAKTPLPEGLMMNIHKEALRRKLAEEAFPAQTQVPLPFGR